MEELTLTRAEWVAVARQLDSTSLGEDPSGLRSRINELLSDVPVGWDAQLCTMALDPAAAAVVRAIVRRGRGQAEDPGRAHARVAGLAEAEAVIRGHQAPPDLRSFRIEHRTESGTTVLSRVTTARVPRIDFDGHLARLSAAGAAGELVLIDESTGRAVARRRLTRPDLGG
jgi:hypothetical protein